MKTLLSGLLYGIYGAATLVLADSSPAPNAQSTAVAPGYGELNFAAPAAGTYSLPPIGVAPDGQVLKDDGQAANLYSLFGEKFVLLSFIYSSCSDVNGCPLAAAVMNLVRQRLNQDAALANQVKLISLSFDPVHDTPEVMRLYGANFKGKGAVGWDFVTTASNEQLKPILKGYSQTIVRDRDANGKDIGTISHVLRVYLLDKQHRIRNIYSAGFLHPNILINDIKTALADNSGSDAPAQPAVAAATAAAPAPVVTGTEYRAGDYKDGYDTANYQTRSVALTERRGKPFDLLALAQHPPLGLPPLPVPEKNPLTADKISLGRKLFFDRRLSLNDTISCAMCHIPEQGFANNELETAVGIEGRTVRRNAPTLYNVGYFKRLFHDGREHALENQIWQPLTAHNEMANPAIGMVIEKLEKLPDYQGLFEKAFGAGPDQSNVGMALASYERSLLVANSPFDRWYYGKDESAVSDDVKRGFAVFSGKGGCTACHLIGPQSALFTDNATHNTGIGFYESMLREPQTHKVQLAPGVFVDTPSDIINQFGEEKPNDLGLYEVTQNPNDRWKYRTPSLRNVALTAPYMHNGSKKTLRDVVEFYNLGGVPNEVLDPLVHPLGLNDAEMSELVSFLSSLTGGNVNDIVSDAFAAPIGDMRKQDPNWTHENRIEY